MSYLIELPSLLLATFADKTAQSRPVVINRNPEPDEQNVPIDTAITLEIVDVRADGIDRAATKVWVNDVLAFVGDESPEIKPGFDGSGAGVIETDDTLKVALNPTAPFESKAHVLVRVVSATKENEHQIDQSYSFEVQDTTPLMLLSAIASSQQEVLLTFDKEVGSPDQAEFIVEAQDAPAMPVQVATASVSGNAVALQLDAAMTADVPYMAMVNGVADTSGNPISPDHNSALFNGFKPPVPPSRNFDLWSMLPSYNRRNDDTGELKRFVSCLQDTTDLLLADVDRFVDIFDIERAPERFINAILADLGNPFMFSLTLQEKRRLASVLVEMYRQKGTAAGIINTLRFFMGIQAEVIPMAGSTLYVGDSLLGESWELGPSDRYTRYAFEVTVPRALSQAERTQARTIIEQIKPAHTHLARLLEPVQPVTYNHWELGLSLLDDNAMLHEQPVSSALWDLAVSLLGINTHLTEVALNHWELSESELGQTTLLHAVISPPIETPVVEHYDHWELGFSEMGETTLPHYTAVVIENWEVGISELNISTDLH